ncbi:methylmalonyl-CoA mutase family protein [Magnetospirillum sulfuroxidans]|uniref:Methylmalonyl-CoA mutase small subunit n=1 Tax=Magnetospirillum sulfuroxidans TaxID=611300 RepID=A0ABS5IH62_9PROT|nr:methylmalonyl-CoA mutase family protein [Magnetospirillum sulfuroxidans]MBR9973765.1 methylmalonyl-CoA mutase small subunit [Magnetospirillum sulfuroxidans]
MTEAALSLAAGFPTPTREQWLVAVDKALKGAPFDNKLVTHLPEGIAVQPLYTRADSPAEGGLPGLAPYTRGATAGGEGWAIRTEHDAADLQAVNTAMLTDLARGATALTLRLDRAVRAGLDGDDPRAEDLAGSDGAMVYSIDDLDRALRGVYLDMVPLALEAGAQAEPAAALLVALWRNRGVVPDQARGAFNADPLGVLAAEGVLGQTLDGALARMAGLAAWTVEHWPNVTAVGVDTSAHYNAGATEAQDLAAALATGLAYLRALVEGGLEIDTACRQMAFTLSVGCDQFLSIAKLRAARLLWARVTEVCGATPPARAMHIHARTAARILSRRDPWVNMLRTTVAAFAAGIGGANSVAVAPFDAALGPSDDFARRIARNSQVLLQEESSLTKVADPAGGSWYVEALTRQLAEAAWALFQDIEGRGGMAAILLDGWWAGQLAESWAAREKNIAKRKDSLTGINEFPNILEQAVERPAPDFAALRMQASVRLAPARIEVPSFAADSLDALVDAAEQGVSIGRMAAALAEGAGLSIPALPRHRHAESFEALRDAADAHKAATGAWPVVFLANLGRVASHTARATYAKNFFEAGGIQALGNSGFKDAESCVQAFKDSGARIAVLCGGDNQYEEHAEAFARALKAAGVQTLFLAGNPGDKRDAYAAAGVDSFISVGCDVLAILRSTLADLGVAL